MEFSGQRRPPSSYQRSLWREDVGCIENRRATDVPKVSARWNRTGYAVCTDLSVCNRGRRMFYLPEERLSKECGSPQLFSALLNNVKTSTSCRCTNEFASVQGAWKRSVASGNTCAVAINFRNFLITLSAPHPPHFFFPLTDSQCQAFARISAVSPFTSAVVQLFSTVRSLDSRFL